MAGGFVADNPCFCIHNLTRTVFEIVPRLHLKPLDTHRAIPAWGECNRDLIESAVTGKKVPQPNEVTVGIVAQLWIAAEGVKFGSFSMIARTCLLQSGIR